MTDIIYNEFFNRKGFVLDDAYDPYKLKAFLKTYAEENVEYIRSKDVDLGNLHCFHDLKYLTISDEAIHYDVLSDLSDLKGMELLYSQLQLIPDKTLESLESLILHFGNETVEPELHFAKLRDLKADGFPGFCNTDLSFISGLSLQRLSVSSRKLKTLKGIGCQQDLASLTIASCSALYDISELCSLTKLKTLCLRECNKLPEDFTDLLPSSLENLSVFGSEYSGPRCSFPTLDFFRKMKKLRVFKTNWRISPEQLASIRRFVPEIEIYT